jgi:hypothetical protein
MARLDIRTASLILSVQLKLLATGYWLLTTFSG